MSGVGTPSSAVITSWTRMPALYAGSVWDMALSSDPQQTFLYVADGENSLIHILRRDTLDILTAFGEGGRQPGQWHGVHNVATDSQGNIYTTETYEGKRVQKFRYVGMGNQMGDVGVPRPQ